VTGGIGTILVVLPWRGSGRKSGNTGSWRENLTRIARIFAD